MNLARPDASSPNREDEERRTLVGAGPLRPRGCPPRAQAVRFTSPGGCDKKFPFSHPSAEGRAV
jgi:hypothetical protein